MGGLIVTLCISLMLSHSGLSQLNNETTPSYNHSLQTHVLVFDFPLKTSFFLAWNPVEHIPVTEWVQQLQTSTHESMTVQAISDTNNTTPIGDLAASISYNTDDDKNTNKGQTFIYRLCGYPAVFDFDRCRSLDMKSDILQKCEADGGVGVFGLAIVFIAIAIICGNASLPIVIVRERDMRTQHNYIKASLSFADMLTGLLLLFSVLPNMFFVRQSTEAELLEIVTYADTNSPRAIIAGSMLTLIVQASLLHLLLLSIDRFIAIKWPMYYRVRRPRAVLSALVCVWGIAVLCAFIPAIFQQYFKYTFIPVLCLHMMTTRIEDGGQVGYHGPLYATLSMLLPYAATVTFSVMTGVTARQKLRFPGHRTLDGQRAINKNRLKSEVAILKTLVIMVLGFTITLLPVVIVYNLVASGVLTCSNYSLIYTVCFYASMSNSFVNVVIYSIREDRFRTAVITIFQVKKIDNKERAKGKSSVITQSTDTSRV